MITRVYISLILRQIDSIFEPSTVTVINSQQLKLQLYNANMYNVVISWQTQILETV